MVRRGGAVWSAWAVLLAAGCGGDGLVTVAGTVTLDGRPLGDATLTFLPEDPAGAPAFARSAADGSFRLNTGNLAGARPGKYKIVVVKDEPVLAGVAGSRPSASGPTGKRIDQASPEELAAGMQARARFPRRSLIPIRYGEADRTPLGCEVPVRGATGVRVVLTSDPD